MTSCQLSTNSSPTRQSWHLLPFAFSFRSIWLAGKVSLPQWWSGVLFPGTSTGRGAENGSRQEFLGIGLLVVAAGLLLFCRPGNPLQEPQEARYAEIPREMLAEGSWVVPLLQGEPYHDKPPLLYWLVLGCYRLFGVHDWAARLTPCMATFLCVMVTFLWGRSTVGWKAGLAGAGILCLSGRFLYLGRLLTFDAVLSLWVVVGLATAHRSLAAGRQAGIVWRWWVLSGIACGLGMLTKGPVALALVACPILMVQFLDNRLVSPRISAWVIYLAVALGVASPWYVAMSLREPDFLLEFFWKHNVVRFASPFDHQEPFWFFLPHLLLGMLPWTLLLPGMIRFLFASSPRTARRRPGALGFFLLAGLWGLAFFSAAGCKRAVYILPVMPPLALALGVYLTSGWPGVGRMPIGKWSFPGRTGLAHFATLVVLALGIGLAVLAFWDDLIGPMQACVGICLLLGGLGFVIWQGLRVREKQSWTMCAVATFGVLLLAVNQVFPGYARKFSLRGQVRRHLAECLDESIPIACYPRAWDSVAFYLQGPSIKVYGLDERDRFIEDLRRNPKTLVFVKSGKALDGFQSALPPDLEFQLTGRQGTVAVGHLVHREKEILNRIP